MSKREKDEHSCVRGSIQYTGSASVYKCIEVKYSATHRTKVTVYNLYNVIFKLKSKGKNDP